MIVVTGGTGMVARALRRSLPDAFYVGRNDADLRSPSDVDRLLDRLSSKSEISVMVHLAARVGGIRDNSTYPYDYFLENALMNLNVLGASVQRKVRRIVAVSSTCVYPRRGASYPMDESMIHEGLPEETNLGYAYAKRLVEIQLRLAHQQHQTSYCVLYPSNLYGPYDHYDQQKSHLVAALIAKFHAAKVEGSDSVQLLGTGAPLRQFTFVNDFADLLSRVVRTETLVGDYNFATPENLSVRDIAGTVAKVVGFGGELVFNGALDGVYRKDVTSDRLAAALGSLHFTSLEEGVRSTYNWYREQAH